MSNQQPALTNFVLTPKERAALARLRELNAGIEALNKTLRSYTDFCTNEKDKMQDWRHVECFLHNAQINVMTPDIIAVIQAKYPFSAEDITKYHAIWVEMCKRPAEQMQKLGKERHKIVETFSSYNRAQTDHFRALIYCFVA